MWSPSRTCPKSTPCSCSLHPRAGQSPGTQHPQTWGKAQIFIQTLQLGFIPSQQQQNKQTDAEEAAETKQQQKRRFWYQVWIFISSVDSELGRRVAGKHLLSLPALGQGLRPAGPAGSPAWLLSPCKPRDCFPGLHAPGGTD